MTLSRGAAPVERFGLCVVGDGAAGQAVAIGAALLGVSVALVGDGDPSDGIVHDLAAAALVAVADHAAAIGRAADFGLGIGVAGADFAAIRRHVEAVLASAAAAGSPERLAALGITLVPGAARFVGPDRLAVGPRLLAARRFVVAQPGRPAVPAVPGLDRVPVLTRRDLETLDHRPGHLAIVGDGAEAIELAQIYRRLGSAVTLIGPGPLLADEDPELVGLLALRLCAEGIALRTETLLGVVEGKAGTVRLTLGTADAAQTIEASHLLVAMGREPDLTGLDLAAAGIAAGPAGIIVDDRLRTTNRRIHALGDAIGRRHRAHRASAEAGVVLRNILFRQRARLDGRAVPRIVQADPGLAQVGLTEAAARAAHGAVTILRWPFHDNDRARAEGTGRGLVKIVTSRRGRILGAGILGPHADELIQVWQLALTQKLKIGALAGLAVPYPTLGEASRRAAAAFFAPKLLSARTRKLVRWLAFLG